VLAADTASIEILVAVIAALLAWRLLGRAGRRHGRDRGRRPRPSDRARCAAHRNKAIFTELEARRFVERSQRQHAAGTWKGSPMDHCYRCPSAPDHWHVSSKRQRVR